MPALPAARPTSQTEDHRHNVIETRYAMLEAADESRRLSLEICADAAVGQSGNSPDQSQNQQSSKIAVIAPLQHMAVSLDASRTQPADPIR